MLLFTCRLPPDPKLVTPAQRILEVAIPVAAMLLGVGQDAYRGLAPLGLTVYITCFLALAAFFRADWGKSLVLYLPAFFAFLLMLAVQDTPRILFLGHFTNSLIGVAVALGVSRVSYLSSAKAYLDKKLLERQKEELQVLDRMKSQLLSSVSHELRTPLTSVIGFTKIIQRDFQSAFAPLAGEEPKAAKLAKRINSNLEIIASEGERLTRLINDVLDLAKIESGRTQWRDQVCPVKDLLEQAAQAVNGEFAGRPEVVLQVLVEQPLPPVQVDRDRLVQVLVNLLSNASKFTTQGRVTLGARTTPQGWVRLEVADTGAGIPPESLGRIFDQFYQVVKEDTLSDKPKGTGLGLSICKQIVEHYQGRIWAESQLGQGSSFIIELPPAPGA
jgi:signal transduction histidine kinase